MVEMVERVLDPSAGSGQALHKQLPEAKVKPARSLPCWSQDDLVRAIRHEPCLMDLCCLLALGQLELSVGITKENT
jgi:hypothetical protein